MRSTFSIITLEMERKYNSTGTALFPSNGTPTVLYLMQKFNIKNFMINVGIFQKLFDCYGSVGFLSISYFEKPF